MPSTYIDFLDNLPHYHRRLPQKIASVLLIAVFLPTILPVFFLSHYLADKEGKNPPILQKVVSFAFSAMWGAHDSFLKYIFGSGEDSPAYCKL
jgi:hypothetical protein